MSYDPTLADRVRSALAQREDVSEKAMFGGLAFMLGDKMCCGVIGSDLVVRLGPSRYEEALWEPHVRPMDFTGKPLTGYVYVAPAGVETVEALQKWVTAGIDFVSILLATPAEATRRSKRPPPKPPVFRPPAAPATKASRPAKAAVKTKTAAKKPAPKKPTAKKPATKRPAAKKASAKKAVPKKKNAAKKGSSKKRAR